MTRHDPQVALLHMRQYAEEAVELVAGKKRLDLETDRLVVLATTRLIEIVGEAATRVPEPIRSQYNIPWGDIIGTRNRLIHGYDNVDLDILWAILTEDLPHLIKAFDSV